MLFSQKRNTKVYITKTEESVAAINSQTIQRIAALLAQLQHIAPIEDSEISNKSPDFWCVLDTFQQLKISNLIAAFSNPQYKSLLSALAHLNGVNQSPGYASKASDKEKIFLVYKILQANLPVRPAPNDDTQFRHEELSKVLRDMVKEQTMSPLRGLSPS